ncbi:T-complex protein 1 subunit zeta-2 isoform X3 [Eubalaena glacialis]|uniref:T-complex protein 1 subunit zeta-2 isoform X3 n=1 Tax=Eubalaena glacialis TaxID=27606 RepID=UPI002A5A3E23|nr:T-complex protein 1 subunit zeta-2 isoform X3 [Eubalaena glacialis]
MLVSGAEDIKLTKDGNVLLHEMQIQHPTASLIAKVATAQDDITGDGTTSNVLIIGELLKQADLYISEGEEKYTFIEDCVYPRSVTLLVKGPNKHTLTQIKDAVRDGLHAIKNAIEDGCMVPGVGAVEVAIAEALVTYKHSIKGRARLGVQAFADALLIIPKVSQWLFDSGICVPCTAADAGVWDNCCVKKQLLHSWARS